MKLFFEDSLMRISNNFLIYPKNNTFLKKFTLSFFVFLN
jgi:hypothetical protein